MNKSKKMALAFLLPCLLLQTQAAKGASQEQGGSKLWTAGKVVGGLAVLGYAGYCYFHHSAQKEVLAVNNTIIKTYQPERESLIQKQLNEDTLLEIIKKRHNDEKDPLYYYNFHLNCDKQFVDHSLLRYNWKPSDEERFQDFSNDLVIVQYFLPIKKLPRLQPCQLQVQDFIKRRAL